MQLPYFKRKNRKKKNKSSKYFLAKYGKKKTLIQTGITYATKTLKSVTFNQIGDVRAVHLVSSHNKTTNFKG